MNKKLIIGIVITLIGIGLFFVPKGNPPQYECAEPGAPDSGFVDGDCRLTIEDFQKYADFQSAPRPFAIAGLGAVILGLVITGLSFKKSKA